MPYKTYAVFFVTNKNLYKFYKLY